MGFEIGKTVAGYEIVEMLGTSATGIAYKVRNVFSQRFEILKILPKEISGNEEQVVRFLREIKVHARLVHPNIVTFYNAREVEGQLVMTTEFVPGITVEERLETGPIAWQEATQYACQALLALEYAHANGIIHRGLTASCLVITPEGIVRLNGFGMAKVVSDPQLTAVGTVVGALRYISPEQVKGLALDARCDIYSLGVVLYEMLTGRLPFEGKGQFEIMLAHVNALPKHPTDVNPDVPRALGDLALMALAKEPDQRFQNAREFRVALEEITGKQVASPAVAAVVAAVLAPSHPEPQPTVAALASGTTSVPPAVLQSGETEPASMFGNSLLAKVAISLAAGAVTFLVGTVALYAYMTMASH
jgi:eukaryotic-like serine/threonine-protein kinase